MKILLFLLVGLVGCASDDAYTMANEHVLCESVTNEAYYVKWSVGDNSTVKPAPNLQKMCGSVVGKSAIDSKN